MATTGSERGLSLRSPGRFMATAQRLVELVRARGTDEVDRLAVAQAWVEAEAYRWYTFGSVTRMLMGRDFGSESSMNKVFWSEMDVRAHETALRILGTDGESVGDGGSERTNWMKGFQFALAGPIYAGTNEIQRNVVAQRVLGLPRK